MRNDLTSPDLTNVDIFPKKGNTKYSCFLGAVNMKGFLIVNIKGFSVSEHQRVSTRTGKHLQRTLSTSVRYYMFDCNHGWL